MYPSSKMIAAKLIHRCVRTISRYSLKIEIIYRTKLLFAMRINEEIQRLERDTLHFRYFDPEILFLLYSNLIP